MIKNYNLYSKKLVTRINYRLFNGCEKFIDKENTHGFIYNTMWFVKYLINFFLKLSLKNPSFNKIIFFSTSRNNNAALSPIMEKLNVSSYVVWDKDDVFPQTTVSFFSFFCIFDLLLVYLKSDQDDRDIINFYFNQFILTYGTFFYLKRYLKKNKHSIKLVVMANDHSMTNRCLLEACKTNGIETLYVQHASVSELFPPLEFSYSFLDGKDSFDKYSSVKLIENTVFFSGCSRYDNCPIRSVHNNFVIGIATNIIDDYKKIMDLCFLLKKRTDAKIIVRPHPASDFSEDFKQNLIENGFIHSDSKIVSSLSFLSEINVLIANESSIHLDAAFMNIPTCLYNMSNKNAIEDVYSYVKKGLMPYCKTENELMEFISNPHMSTEKVKYYLANFNTKYRNSVSKIISGFIQKIIDGENIDEYINQFFHKENNYYVYNE